MSVTQAKPDPNAGILHETILNALPHPVLTVAPNGYVVEANVAAEAFFESGLQVLRRHPLKDFVPFGSPLIALIEQVRNTTAPVNEYRVDLGTPRNGSERLADLHVAPLPERPGHVVLVLQERSMADASIYDSLRTPRGSGRATGSLHTLSPIDLGATVLKALDERTGCTSPPRA